MLTIDSNVQTRDGREAQIVAVLKNDNEEWPVIAVLKEEDEAEVYETYTTSGHYAGDTTEDPRDLIAITPKLRGFLNIYDSGYSWHPDLETAKKNGGSSVKAIVALSNHDLVDVRDQ